MNFTKMHGIGNDFVMVNAERESLPADLAALSQATCDRKFGIGADGLILAERGTDAPFRMRMFNPDGSESEMCGNGIRCFAQFVCDQGMTDATDIPVETGAGLLNLHIRKDGQVRVDMGLARLTRTEIGMTAGDPDPFINAPIAGFQGTAVSMGNPHVVIFTENAAGIDLAQIGPRIERDLLFPKRVNVHFVQVLGRGELIQRTWERGAGITLACGTGACACGVAAFLNGHADRNVLIHLPGGDLEIQYDEDGRVWMTGPAQTVYTGTWA